MTETPLRKWFEVGFHTHSRLSGHLPPNDGQQKNESLTHDAQITLDALRQYAEKFMGKGALICDTDHAFHILDRLGIPRLEAFKPNNIDESISFISRGVEARAQTISSSSEYVNFMTGVEADILNPDGKLDVDNAVLRKLDVVIASIHWNWWNYTNGIGPSTNEYLTAIKMTASNPDIDVIGHPFRDLHEDQRKTISVEDWDSLLKTLRANGVAFEINLSGYYPNDEKRLAEEVIIQRGVALGVNFIIGLDFHNFTEYQGSLPEGTLVTQENVEEVFKANKGAPNIRLFMRMAKLKRELENLGVNPNNVLNSSKEKFNSWLRKRNEK